MAFKEKLRALRMENKLTQKKLADLIGASQSAVYQWEKGERKPKIEQLNRLCHVFDVSMEVLEPNWITDAIEFQKDIEREIKEVSNSTDLSLNEKEKKMMQLQNEHLTAGIALNKEEERYKEELSWYAASLTLEGKKILMDCAKGLFHSGVYQAERVDAHLARLIDNNTKTPDTN